MKKLGLALLSIIIIAAYYFNTGSEQLRVEMKAQVNKELASLQIQGFSVQAREITEKKEHFVISFDEHEKIAAYFTKHGTQLSPEDAKAFKGLKIGVDLNYLADAYSGISFDLYPLALPGSITSSASTLEDKKILTQIQQMLDKKVFLIHCDINKLGTSFKGYMKDIDEILESDIKVKMVLSKLKFSGDIKNETVHNLQQTMDSITIHTEDRDDTFNFEMQGLESIYTMTEPSKYDYQTSYSIDKMTMQEEKSGMSLLIEYFEANSQSSIKDSLASTLLKTKTNSITLKDKSNEIILNTLLLDMKANNLDLQTLEALGKVDPNNEKEINAMTQKLLSHGIEFELPTFSIATIENTGQKMEGFHLSSFIHINPSLNIAALEQNPLLALNAFNLNLDLSLSKELYTFIKQQPQAIMLMMLFHPKDIKGKKVYKVELKDGRLNVNGSPVM